MKMKTFSSLVEFDISFRRFFLYFLLYCFLMAGYLLRSWHLSLMEFSSEPWKHCDSPSQSLLKSNNCRTSVEAFTCGGEKDTPILEGSLTLILNLTRIRDGGFRCILSTTWQVGKASAAKKTAVKTPQHSYDMLIRNLMNRNSSIARL